MAIIDSDAAPDPHKLAKLARQTYSSMERRRRFDQISFLDDQYFYPSQLKFFADGAGTASIRIITGGNQVGKTRAACAEVAWHLMGGSKYPDWWRGKRFNKPIRAWAVGMSGILVRDSLQRHLCGGNEFGSGLIPLEAFAKKPTMVPGGTGAIDTIYVTHYDANGKPDGISSLSFKSYEQRRERLQSETIDLCIADERPPLDVMSELQARTVASNGIILISYTAAGEDADGVDYRFFSTSSADRLVTFISADEAKHISEERREALAQELPEHEVQTRLHGTPAQGRGPIFDPALINNATRYFDLEEVKRAQHIIGVDLGWGHGFAAVWLAWSPEMQKYWILDSFMMRESTIGDHVRRLHAMTQGLKILIAYPHDGNQHNRVDGRSFAQIYRDEGANMMLQHVTNKGGGLSPEVGIAQIRQALAENRFAINKSNTELIQQLRLYHRGDDYKPVKANDDLVDALRYAWLAKDRAKMLDEYDGIGYGRAPYAHQRRANSGPQMAQGIDFPLWD
jgi:phage terminase large subunit-like protein